MRKKDGVQAVLKKFKKLVTEKNVKEASKYLSTVQKTLDKAAKTGLLKKNMVSRKKSRLSAMIKKLG